MDDLISRSALLELFKFRLPTDNESAKIISKCVEIARYRIENAPAVDAVEVCRCKDCELWDREHKEMHQHSTEHPEVQAEFAECRKWSTWSTCMMLRADDFCSQAERRVEYTITTETLTMDEHIRFEDLGQEV